MPDTKQKPGYSGSSFSSPYKPFQSVNGGSSVNQCLPGSPNSPEWAHPRYDYSASSRYGTTYLSQGPLASPQTSGGTSLSDMADRVKKVWDVSEKWTELGMTQRALNGLNNAVDSLSIMKARSLRPMITKVPETTFVFRLVEYWDNFTYQAHIEIRAIQNMVDVVDMKSTNFTWALEAIQNKLAYLRDLTNNAAEYIPKAIDNALSELDNKARNLPSKFMIMARRAAQQMATNWPKIISGLKRLFGALLKPLDVFIAIWQASDKREAYQQDPFSPKAKEEYTISVISVLVTALVALIIATVVALAGIFGATVGAIVAFWVGVFIMGYTLLSLAMSVIWDKQDPIAEALYAKFPETMTKVAFALDSFCVWFSEKAIEIVRRGETFIFEVSEEIRKKATELYNKALDSNLGQSVGDTLMNTRDTLFGLP